MGLFVGSVTGLDVGDLEGDFVGLSVIVVVVVVEVVDVVALRGSCTE